MMMHERSYLYGDDGAASLPFELTTTPSSSSPRDAERGEVKQTGERELEGEGVEHLVQRTPDVVVDDVEEGPHGDLSPVPSQDRQIVLARRPRAGLA